jgi:hypothetical protein
VADDEETIVAWEPDDPENPYNWSNVREHLHVRSYHLVTSNMIWTGKKDGDSLDVHDAHH